jgi:hypothetical protein
LLFGVVNAVHTPSEPVIIAAATAQEV